MARPSGLSAGGRPRYPRPHLSGPPTSPRGARRSSRGDPRESHAAGQRGHPASTPYARRTLTRRRCRDDDLYCSAREGSSDPRSSRRASPRSRSPGGQGDQVPITRWPHMGSSRPRVEEARRLHPRLLLPRPRGDRRLKGPLRREPRGVPSILGIDIRRHVHDSWSTTTTRRAMEPPVLTTHTTRRASGASWAVEGLLDQARVDPAGVLGRSTHHDLHPTPLIERRARSPPDHGRGLRGHARDRPRGRK